MDINKILEESKKKKRKSENTRKNFANISIVAKRNLKNQWFDYCNKHQTTSNKLLITFIKECLKEDK